MNLKTSAIGDILKSAIRNPQSAIAIVFAAMLAVSWRRWTSPIADSGREMDLPMRLLDGEWLYRDVHHIYPPLAPYFNALLYSLFGAHLDVLHAAGIACSVLIIAICYRIARRLLDPVGAATATIAVVVFCIFKPAGNLIQPYSFAALFGCLFALGTLLMTLRHAEHSRRCELLLAGVLIGFAAVTKQEFALAGAVTVAAALVYRRGTNLRPQISDLLSAALPAALIALPVYGWLLYKFGWQTIVEDCHLFYTHLPPSLVLYNSQRTGMDRPLLSLAQMIGAAAVTTAALSFVVMLSDRKRKVLKQSALALVTSFAAIFLIKLLVGKQWDGSPLRALPFMLAGIVLAGIWRARIGAGRSQEGIRNQILVITAVFGFAILARVALRVPSGGAFGGFFLPIPLILFCAIFSRFIPALVGDWTGVEVSARRARLIGTGVLMATILVGAVTFGVRYRRNFNVEIVAERGHLFAPRVTGREIAEALSFISGSTAPNEPIAVLPEGSDLAFLTGRRMPLRHQIMIPGLMSQRDEQQAINRLRQERVSYILIVNRPMREFGQEAFGRDFYTQFGGWIDENYRPVKVCGPAGSVDPQIGDAQFFIKILQRKD